MFPLGPKKDDLTLSSLERDRDLLKEFILTFGGEKFSGKGLSALRDQLFKGLQRVKDIPVVTVCGTNGKGEVAMLLSGRLSQRGVRTLTLISPHLLSLRERILLQGEWIDFSFWSESLQKLQKDFPKNHLSFYEAIFACFLHLADRLKPDLLICEVGLGGRLDAVNLLDASLVALTSISRDHCEFLGHELTSILQEKLGVLREGIVCVSSLEQKELQERAREICDQRNCHHKDLFVQKELKESDSFEKRNRLLSERVEKEVENLGIKTHSPFSPKTPLYLWGRRMPVTLKGRDLILLGAHNGDGAKKIVDSCGKFSFPTPQTALCGLPKRDLHQVKEIMETLCLGPFNEVVFSAFTHPRALEQELLEKLFVEFKLHPKFGKKTKLLDEGQWEEWIHTSKESLLITGSYYFLGEVMGALLSFKDCEFPTLSPSA